MALIVGVHGIAQQLKAPEQLVAEWEPAMRGGVSLAGGTLPTGSLACAFYGNLFRKGGKVRSVGVEHFVEADVGPKEAELLRMLLESARQTDPGLFPSANARGRASTSTGVQAMLRLLARSPFLTGIASRAFIGDLKQVTRYMEDDAYKTSARQSVDDVVTEDTQVIVAHSLGTVVAYEALATFAGTPRWANVRALVTMGSPLGISNLIFERLEPAPVAGKGTWPAGIAHWTNVSDNGDIVALRKELGPLFGDTLVDIGIDNEARAHDVSPYLTAPETGRAILKGLS